MNVIVEIGTEAAQFTGKEDINGIFVAVYSCVYWVLNPWFLMSVCLIGSWYKNPDQMIKEGDCPKIKGLMGEYPDPTIMVGEGPTLACVRILIGCWGPDLTVGVV
jgi:hypothetical protein